MDYVKEAEKNVVRIAKHLSDMLKVLEALSRFGNGFFHREENDKYLFFGGLRKMREAVYSKYVYMLSQCFFFAGVGEGDAEKYSFERFKDHFGDELYSITQFLDRYGEPMSWYSSEMNEEFRKQAKNLIFEKEEEFKDVRDKR